MAARRSVAVVAVGALVAILAACGGGSTGQDGATTGTGTTGDPAFDKLVSAAQKEGTVVFYGGQDDAVLQNIQKTFGKRYGIRVDYQRLTSEMPQLVEKQVSAGKVAFDVALATDEYWVSQRAEQGYWLDVDYTLPATAKIPQAQRRDAFVPAGYALPVVTYNTDNVAKQDAPATIDDLLDPAFKDRIALVSPAVAVSISSAYWMWLDKLGKPGFEEFLDKLFANGATVVDSGSTVAQQVAAGEYDLALGTSLTYVSTLQGKGAPVDYAQPDPSSAVMRTAEVAADAPHPNAGRLFVDWLLSEEGQEIINGDGGSVGAYPGSARSALDMPDGVVVPDVAEVTRDWGYLKRAFAEASGE